MLVFAEPTDVPGVPTGSEDGPDGVVPVAEEVADVVGLVLDAFSVVRPAGRQDRVADAVAVEPELV
mgnify:CR=1 FL=1